MVLTNISVLGIRERGVEKGREIFGAGFLARGEALGGLYPLSPFGLPGAPDHKPPRRRARHDRAARVLEVRCIAFTIVTQDLATRGIP